MARKRIPNVELLDPRQRKFRGGTAFNPNIGPSKARQQFGMGLQLRQGQRKQRGTPSRVAQNEIFKEDLQELRKDIKEIARLLKELKTKVDNRFPG